MSAIEWTDQTWNVMTGCTKVSPGCDHCYMYREYPRLRAMGVKGYQRSPDTVTFLEERLKQPLRWKKLRRIFVNSMSDLFHREADFQFILRAFQVMFQAAEERGHIFQVLTKRPGRAVAFWERYKSVLGGQWRPNVWIGTSVESQKHAPRLSVLARLPAPVRFCSAEPLLGPLDLGPWLDDVQWLIGGGESGPDARPMETEWAQDLRDQARGAGVAFFLKQLGGHPDKRGGLKALLDGRRHTDMPVLTTSTREAGG